jgi:hypothetical protein
MGVKEKRYGTYLTVSRYDLMLGSCECCYEPLHSIKGGEFDQLSTYQLLKQDHTLLSSLIHKHYLMVYIQNN